MNKFTRAVIELPTGVLKAVANNLKFGGIRVSVKCAISPMAELTIDRGAKCNIGKLFRARSGCHIRVRRGARLIIGENTSVNHGCMIVCHENIKIGNNVQLSPNVMIYDHDHDFRAQGGIKEMKYKTSPIIIGNNVWIGANSIILRGSTIGDNAVIGAGSIVKGQVPAGEVFVQKRKGIAEG